MKNSDQKFNFSFFLVVKPFFLWVVLSGCSEPFFIFCGILSSIFTLFIFKRLIYAEETLIQILNCSRRLSLYKLLVYYIPWLAYQALLSSIYVTKKILETKVKLEPIFLTKKCEMHTKKSIALFANSVIITPGTLTVNVKRRERVYISTLYLIDKTLRRSVSEIESRVLQLLSVSH